MLTSAFRLCLVAVKRFPENTYFPEMLISRKGKCFHVFGCISKIFWKIFSGVWKRRRKTQIQKTQATTQKKIINVAILRRRDRDQRRDQRFARSRHRSRSRSGVISRRQDRDLDPAPFFDLARLFFLSLSCCVFCFFSPSLCVLRDPEVI